MEPQFFQTRMGQRFYEHTMPAIAKNLSLLAQETKRANDLKEKELELAANNKEEK